MDLKRYGKYLLPLSSLVFVLSIAVVFTGVRPEEAILAQLGSYLLLCLSIAFIFYHSPAGKRKKAVTVLSCISGFIFLAGIVSKFMHWYGAAVEVILATGLFAFALLPLIIKSRYEKRKQIVSSKSNWLSLADLLSVLFLVSGLLFRLLHWPGANELIILGILLLIISFVGWNVSFRKEVKRRKVAEEKLHKALETVEEKHKEITDSINYAERIQRSFLASRELLDEHLKDYFVFFQPKDVVSGDFYWASVLNDGNFVYATADSTGHGVPGAIMSLLNVSSLEKAIEKQSSPAAILNETRRHIIERLKKDGSAEGGKDGMDCSIVVLDKNRKQLRYAAANNPLWIVRGNELLEFDPDKMPVGKHDKDQIPFTETKIDLQNGDVVYTLTDGMPDQFGGPRGKKFMYKKLKELLVSISALPMEQHREKLRLEFQSWKGELEQVDDVCIIGVRV